MNTSALAKLVSRLPHWFAVAPVTTTIVTIAVGAYVIAKESK